MNDKIKLLLNNSSLMMIWLKHKIETHDIVIESINIGSYLEMSITTNNKETQYRIVGITIAMQEFDDRSEYDVWYKEKDYAYEQVYRSFDDIIDTIKKLIETVEKDKK